MQFVQADPIRAPARAQDLILRQRVQDYRAGDLERRYATLDIEEDVFVNYGFVTTSLRALMGVREIAEVEEQKNGSGKKGITELVLDFVRERGAVHPREVDEHFAHGTVKNYWGGSSNATTQLLENMHYRGLLRVARRENGIRIYQKPDRKGGLPRRKPQALPYGRASVKPESLIDPADLRARVDALVDVVVNIYAPLPGPSLSYYVRRLRYAAPQWQSELTGALQRARERLSHASVDGVDWYWQDKSQVLTSQVSRPTAQLPFKASAYTLQPQVSPQSPDTVRLLAPFDPLVHDRARFELLWGWAYRFEAYTPVSKRRLGYYALPLLWRDRVIGWANLSLKDGELRSEFGYAGSQPRDRSFKRELAAELNRMRFFLGLQG
jgi:uncharacterized protein YcaQ